MQFLRGRKLNLAVAFACCLGISMILSCSDEASSGREQGQTDIPLEERESWKDVQEAVEEGRPRTAKKLLKPIIEKALNEKEYDTATRAIGLKARLEAQIQGNKPTAMIVELEDEIGVAPQPMRPIMHVFLADWYWEYYRQNKLRFWQRTKTDKSSAEEIWSWDLPRVFSAIDKNLHCALAAKAFLQQTPVEQYSNLLQKGRMPDRYRPTLYDFAVQEAIEFYCSGEQAAVKPLDAFVLQAKSPVFDSLKEFLNWDIKTTDQDSRLYKAVRLYQDVLRFHRQAGNKDALIDWNLHRLRLGYNKAAGEEKAERYKMALRRFVRLNRGHEISVRAQYRLASLFQEEGEPARARKLAMRARNTFPESRGARLCRNLIKEIEAPDAKMRTERVWNECDTKIRVEYKNVTKMNFRIVPGDWEKELQEDPGRHPENIWHKESNKDIVGAEPVLEWSEELPPTEDYRMRVETFSAPEITAPGFYWLLASPRSEFEREGEGDEGPPVLYAPIWRSDLALVMREPKGGFGIQGLVVNAVSGEPVQGVKIDGWALEYADKKLKRLEPGASSGYGLFDLWAEGPRYVNRKHVILARKNDQILASATHNVARHGGGSGASFKASIFFTDRAIYRPGQTIRYKGIYAAIDGEDNNYNVIPGAHLTVQFRDANRKVIASQLVKTNDYGSFSGSFTAPRDRLTGTMALTTKGSGAYLSRYVTVEEYKRPTFEMSLQAPQKSPKLGEQVKMTGKAISYTGTPIDGASVRWRVKRHVRYPTWCYYWWQQRWLRVAGTRGGQEIARGTTKTDADGTFGIQFVARPSPDARKEGNPVFRYVVHADVTDSAGETRSDDRTISAGYKALNVDLTADEWIVDRKPFEISVHTTSLDGEPRSADGFLKIYSLKMPPKVHRKPLRRGKKTTLSDPNNWPLGEVVGQYEIATDSSGYDSCTANLKTGAYRAVVEMQNQNAGSVYARIPLLVLNPQADRLAIPIPNLFKAPTWTVQPGDIFKAVWGSGYNEARAYVEIRHRNYVLQSYWTDSDRTQQLITLEVTEKLRGGFSINVTMVRENRAYFVSKRVKVPWTNKRLDISWEHFTSKLKPGQEESWTAVIKGPDSERVAAEMVATLYDRSLDQLLPHRWWNGTGLFYSDYSGFRSTFENETQYLYLLDGCWYPRGDRVRLDYRSFPRFLWDESVEKCEMRVPPSYDSRAGNENLMEAPEKKMGRDEGKVRKDLGATAFFFPHLTSGENGEVRIEFTMPDTLTGWRFIGFAHDKKLRAGVLTDTAITAKKLMVKPNPPRFLRAGDVLEFTVRVINSSSEQQKGVVKLNFENPHTQKSAGRALGNENSEKEFCVPPEQSRTFSWRIEAPDQPNILLYRAIASSEQFSDGVEDYLPVLPRRITVTESLPLYIQGPGTRQFNFEKLSNAEESETLQSKALTVQMASNPSWYAVMALPYLMRYPFGCSEQIFNRLYARKLAQHIADSNPKIRQMFNQWKGTDALKSPLEKNEELTEVLLEETPWTRQAEWETRARQSVGKLFDKNRLRAQTFLAMQSLSELQYDDGSWPWFPGGPSNYYITLYLTTGFARLRHLGIDVDMSMAYDALEWLDERMEEKYESIVKRKNPQNHTLGPRMCMYLCTRTFFLKDQPAKDEFQMAMEFFVAQAKKGWLRVRWRQSQAHLALALSRLGEQDAARAIMRSLKERSVTKKDMGRYWRDQEYSWWWYRARIETQALMIEAFDEVMHDREAVEQCKIWLLNEKRAQGWYTTKATADAIYALLLRGADVLESDDLVEVSLGDKKIDPENAEAGTGFYEECFIGSEITPQMGEAIVRKRDKGVSWGGIHWQYLEDISNITAQNKTPLRIEKALFTKEETKHGPVLNLVDGPVEVGDELVSRLVLHARRNMEYVHLKDYRGSGTEPVNVLSRYLYADGLRYYQSTRDTATNFFIDYLPKGTYVLEYSVRVQHRGTYETGIAKVRCMYAPEFNSHSESVVLEVR